MSPSTACCNGSRASHVPSSSPPSSLPPHHPIPSPPPQKRPLESEQSAVCSDSKRFKRDETQSDSQPQLPCEPRRDLRQSAPYDSRRDLRQSAPYDSRRDLHQSAPYDSRRDLHQSAPYDSRRDLHQSAPYDSRRDLRQSAPYDSRRDHNQWAPRVSWSGQHHSAPQHTHYKPPAKFEQPPPFCLTDADIQTYFGGIPQIFKHCEGADTIEQVSLLDLPISRCLYGGNRLNGTLRSANCPTSWLVLPAYLNKEGKFNDFQLVISGSIKHGETVLASSKREISEEIGFTFDDGPIVTTEPFNFIKNKTVAPSVYKPNALRPNVLGSESGKDDKDRKVATWLVIDNPNQVIPRRRTGSTDKAGVFVIVMKVADVITLIDNLKW